MKMLPENYFNVQPSATLSRVYNEIQSIQSEIRNCSSESEQGKEALEVLQRETKSLREQKEELNEKITKTTNEMRRLVIKQLNESQKLKNAYDKLEEAMSTKNNELKKLVNDNSEKRVTEIKNAFEDKKRSVEESLQQSKVEASAAVERANAQVLQVAEEAERKRQEENAKAEVTKLQVIEEASNQKQAAIELAANFQLEAQKNALLTVNKEQENMNNEIEKQKLQSEEAQIVADNQTNEIQAQVLYEKNNLDNWKKRYDDLLFTLDTRVTSSELESKEVNLEGGDRGNVLLRETLEREFGEEMNKVIYNSSAELKEKIQENLKLTLSNLEFKVSSLATTIEQREEILQKFKEYMNSESSWVPQVKTLAGYLKKAFEDFLTNVSIDLQLKVLGSRSQETDSTATEKNNNNAMSNLIECIDRIRSLAIKYSDKQVN
jgi:hypothetical protein